MHETRLVGLAASKNAFKSPTSSSPFSYELPQVAHYSGGEYFKTHEVGFARSFCSSVRPFVRLCIRSPFVSSELYTCHSFIRS